MKVNEIVTPALILNKTVMEDNAGRMAALLAKSPMTLYPHYKSNKCPTIAKWQMEQGAGGITCAKLSEAEDLAEAGIPTIVIANQVVQKEKMPRLAALAEKCDLTVCVDCVEQVEMLQQIMSAFGVKVRVLVEYEVGMCRCGVESFEEFLTVAQAVDQQSHLLFDGIQAYAGHLAHETRTEYRKSEMLKIEQLIHELKDYVEANGLTVRNICGGSTGTAADKPADTAYTQLQAGSYIFMDSSYEKLNLRFEQSLFLLTSVISVRPDHVVVDTGVKSVTMDQRPPEFPEYPGVEISFSEEHMTLMMKPDGLKLGDKIRCIPGHCCTTMNVFDEVYVIDGDDVVDVWPIVSRGKAQ